ncbi:MAG: hypothetical protein JO249_12265 [Acidobacteria bacterium]|nr:hypothetical protein [Acidobacteriota bacterium]
MPRCRQNSAYQRCGAVNRRLQSSIARDESNLPLSEPIKGVILTQNCQEAGECRLKLLQVPVFVAKLRDRRVFCLAGPPTIATRRLARWR